MHIKNKKKIDVVILSLCNTDKNYQMNMDCINSLINSELNINFNIFILETNKNFSTRWSYPFDNVKVIFPEDDFNYNKYVNEGLKLTHSELICICNNDLIFQKNWITEIINFSNQHREVLSFSPFDPNSHQQRSALLETSYSIGYRVRTEVAGWCIVIKRKALNIFQTFDEDFDYYFQDNDYSYCLRKNNIRHALVGNSIVNHLENMTSNTVSEYNYSNRGKLDELKFIKKWGSYKSLSRKNRIHKYINSPWLRPLSKILYSKLVNLE